MAASGNHTGSPEPTSQAVLSVEGLSVVVNTSKKERRTLLHEVSFVAEPGEVMAVMGPSGSGKTTLLNRLAGRPIKGEVTGTMSLSGRKLGSVGSSIGYVTQDDIMQQTLTPREILSFSAQFLRTGEDREQQRLAVDKIIKRLRLERCADTVVGTPGVTKGISGGERKRTNVARSLLGNPALLLMDEPTSGLDAKMAKELIVDVNEVASQGCTVVTAIHQPSDKVFEYFSKVLLLKSGVIAYFGPIRQLLCVLETVGLPVPARTPLPEHLLSILEPPAGEEAAAEGGGDLGQDDHEAKLHALLERSLTPNDTPASRGRDSTLVLPTRLGFWGQLSVLSKRNFLAVRRNKLLTHVRFAQSLLSAVLVGWIFFQINRNIDGLRYRQFCAFLLGLGQFLFATVSVVNTFPEEHAVFLREAQDKWYRPGVFFISKVVLDTVMQCLFAVVPAATGYWMIGLNHDSAMQPLVFVATVALVSNCGAAIGFIVSAAVSSVSTALAVVPALVMPQFLLSGLFISATEMTQPFHALSFLVMARYFLQAIVTNEFNCEENPACTDEWRSRSDCDNSPCNFCCSQKDLDVSGGFCPVLTCADALALIGFDADSIWPSGGTASETVGYNLLALGLLLVVFRVAGLAALQISYLRAVAGG